MGEDNDLEFFGVTIKCKSAHLAALLNSSVTEDVVVVGRRASAVFAGDPRADEPESEARSDAEERDELLAMICESQ